MTKFLKLVHCHFFIPDLSIRQFTFKVLYLVILYENYIKVKQNYNTFTVPCEKSKIVSFASSIMKTTSARSRFPVKLICFIAFGSASSAYCLLKSVAVIL